MKKLIIIFFILFSVSTSAQTRFMLKVEPFIKHPKDNKIYNYFNIQIAYHNKINSKFYYELQPGIIFADPALHIDFLFGYKPSFFYVKAGMMLYLGFIGGGNSGTSTEIYSLPVIGIGGELGKRFVLEFNYMVAYFTFGVGYGF